MGVFGEGSGLKGRQWRQLGGAAMVHAASDGFAGILPVVMPVMVDVFDLGKARGITLLAVFGLVCNWAQVLIGHLRAEKTRPLFAPIGLVLPVGICFAGFVPTSAAAWPLLCVVVVAAALGVAFTHPEGLRMVHRLDAIPGTIGTTVFLQAGFVGFSGAGFLAGVMVQRAGLKAMSAFVVGPVIALALMYLLRLRLASEGSEGEDAAVDARANGGVAFWTIMVMAIPTAIACATITSLVAWQGREMGFEVSYGGLAVMLIGAGGAASSFLWAALARRRGEISCCAVALLTGVPFLVLYQLLVDHREAVWLLAPAGFGSFGAFPLLVSLARRARGLNLGGRMAVVVGGSWGVASVVLVGLGGVAEAAGVRAILNYAWIGHLVSGIVAIVVMWQRTRRREAPGASAQGRSLSRG